MSPPNLIDDRRHLNRRMLQTRSKASSLVLGCPWPSEVLSSSASANWNDILLETHSAAPERCSSEAMEMHVVSLVLDATSEFSRKDALGRPVAYLKTPEVITLTPAGFASDFGLHTPAQFVHVGLDRSLIARVLEESDRTTHAASSQRIGIRDRSMLQIVDLLRRELDAESPAGRLYIDSLATALATRYLEAEEVTASAPSRVHPLPRRVLERIKAKMNASIGSDLSLRDLAREAGYSNAHFLRMFRASTGSTPHHFFLSLRLKKAQDLLCVQDCGSIVEVASLCGFSTQSYFTSMFRRRFGVTPSAYRRSRSPGS